MNYFLKSGANWLQRENTRDWYLFHMGQYGT